MSSVKLGFVVRPYRGAHGIGLHKCAVCAKHDKCKRERLAQKRMRNIATAQELIADKEDEGFSMMGITEWAIWECDDFDGQV